MKGGKNMSFDFVGEKRRRVEQFELVQFSTVHCVAITSGRESNIQFVRLRARSEQPSRRQSRALNPIAIQQPIAADHQPRFLQPLVPLERQQNLNVFQRCYGASGAIVFETQRNPDAGGTRSAVRFTAVPPPAGMRNNSEALAVPSVTDR